MEIIVKSRSPKAAVTAAYKRGLRFRFTRASIDRVYLEADDSPQSIAIVKLWIAELRQKRRPAVHIVYAHYTP